MEQLTGLRKDPYRHYARSHKEWKRAEFWSGVFTGTFLGLGIGFFLAILFLAGQVKP